MRLKLQGFRARSAQNGAETAVLENFSDYLEKLLLENVIKHNLFGILGFEKIFVFLSDICL